jgi:hypothetical protein
VDCHDRLLPGKRCRYLSTRVSLVHLALGESPCGPKVFHHGAVFELVFDGVRVARTSCIQKFLEMVFQLPHLALVIMLSDRDMPLIRVIQFLVIIVIAGTDCDPLGAPLLSHFATPAPFLSPLLVALDGTTQLLLGTIFPLPRTNTALTTSLPEACQVVISSLFLVVYLTALFGARKG